MPPMPTSATAASGVRVFLYDAGFMHAKTVTVDDDVAVVGTCNWDIRSLLLHEEVVAVLYDRELVAESAAQYAADLRSCRELTGNGAGCLSRPRRVRNSLCRLDLPTPLDGGRNGRRRAADHPSPSEGP